MCFVLAQVKREIGQHQKKRQKFNQKFLFLCGLIYHLIYPFIKMMSARLRWYGHVKRREEGYVGKRMMEVTVPGRRKRGRPRRSWMDLAREDLKSVEAKEGDEVDRVKWRILSRCGDPE